MSRQILRPVKVWTDERGHPKRFVWHDVTYTGRVVSSWKLSDKWWEPDLYSDRTYYRLETADHQIFELSVTPPRMGCGFSRTFRIECLPCASSRL